MTHDPRVLAQALEDLGEELARWTSVASDTLGAASQAQRLVQERVTQELHRAGVLRSEVESDTQRVEEAAAMVANCQAQSQAATQEARDTLLAAEADVRLADGTLRRWQHELAEALAWLARAEARLAAAIEALHRAEAQLAAARNALERAISNYNWCRSDPKRNCAGALGNVRAAEAAVYQAQEELVRAQQEYVAAQEDRDRAQARVDCCERAVDLSTQAVGLADQALQEAGEAITAAERSLEFIEAAQRSIEAANIQAEMEMAAVMSMLTEVQGAQTLVEEGALHLRYADDAEGAAQRSSSSGRQELQHRIDALHEMNRPTLTL